MQRHDDDFDNGVLRDGRSYRVPVRLADSQAFPRPRNRCFVVDQAGGTAGLHRPGPRYAAGGSGGDAALRDSYREQSEWARDRYIHDISNAWKRRDEWPRKADDDDDDDAETEARAGAIRNALLSRGHDPGDVEDYLDNCDDDELLDNDLGEHIAAFEQSLNGRDAQAVARDRRKRLDEIYAARDAELANAWRKGK
jgi:hypothetical protein